MLPAVILLALFGVLYAAKKLPSTEQAIPAKSLAASAPVPRRTKGAAKVQDNGSSAPAEERLSFLSAARIRQRWDAFGSTPGSPKQTAAADAYAESEADVAAFMPKRELLNRHMNIRLRSIGETAQPPAFPTPEEALQVFATTQVR